jgi:hypothetical protein
VSGIVIPTSGPVRERYAVFRESLGLAPVLPASQADTRTVKPAEKPLPRRRIYHVEVARCCGGRHTRARKVEAKEFKDTHHETCIHCGQALRYAVPERRRRK